MRRVLAGAVALIVLVLTAPLAFVGATPITPACDDVGLSADEGGQTDSSTSYWPPGVKCKATSANGQIREETYVTWFELTMATLISLTAGLLAAAALRVVAAKVLALTAGLVVTVFLIATTAFFF